jgi:hypothetical protein
VTVHARVTIPFEELIQLGQNPDKHGALLSTAVFADLPVHLSLSA